MADQNYTLVVGALEFPITPRFFPKLTFNWKRSGHEVAVIDSVPVHGWFSSNDQDEVWLAVASLQAMAAPGHFQSMLFKKADGTPLYSYSNATIEDLRIEDADGGLVNHVEFNFTIREERGVTFPNLVDVSHEDEEIQEYDQEKQTMVSKFRRRVSATGVRGQTGPARAFVEGLRPSLDNMMRESITTTNYEGQVVGVWDFDDTQSKKGQIKRWHERATYMPGIRRHRFYATNSIPVLIEGGFGPSAIRVQGTIERYDGAFPSADELVGYYKAFAPAATKIVFEDRPEFGGVYVTAWDPKDPLQPTAFGLDYAYTLEFGESDPQPGLPIRPRDDRSG